LALNGFAGWIGGPLKEKYGWKYASDILRVLFGVILATIAVIALES
jgi:hypothetical protein